MSPTSTASSGCSERAWDAVQRRKKREDRSLYSLIRNAVAAGMGSTETDKKTLESLKA